MSDRDWPEVMASRSASVCEACGYGVGPLRIKPIPVPGLGFYCPACKSSAGYLKAA